MPRTRISVELLDADGCIYNYRYLACMNMIASRYGTFFKNCVNQMPLDQTQIRIVERRFKRIIRTIKTSDDAHMLSYSRICGKDIVETIFNIMRLSYEIDADENLYSFILFWFNMNLIEYIKQREDDYDRCLLMVGSQRQSQIYDKEGMQVNGTGSIFQDIYFLKHELRQILPNKKFSLNKLTLTDLQQQRPIGETFSKIIEKDLHSHHYTHFYDATKLSILYGAIHHVAVTERNADIAVNFYDDLMCDEPENDILHTLFRLFSAYPELLPANVTLKLHHYTGTINNIQVIIGKGVIDYRYPENTRLLAKLCGHDLLNPYLHLDIARMLNVEEFLARRVTGTELIPYYHNQIGLLFSSQANVLELEQIEFKLKIS